MNNPLDTDRDLEQRLAAVFSDLMVRETVPVQKRTKLNCVDWDSLMQLNLLLAIEQEFEVTLTDDEAVELVSFKAALVIVFEKLAAGREGPRE